jgi:hypothetical protein
MGSVSTLLCRGLPKIDSKILGPLPQHDIPMEVSSLGRLVIYDVIWDREVACTGFV